MIVLDTAILSYAVGTDHPLREPCRRLLQSHRDGRIEATTTVETVQEFAHVRSRWRSRTDAAGLAREYASAFALLTTSAEDLDLGLMLFVRYPALGAFDAVLAAVTLNRGADALVSADRAFGAIPRFPWVNPATSALDRLIGRS